MNMMLEDLDSITKGIEANEEQLNRLFSDLLYGLEEDINESKENVARYLKMFKNNPDALEIYGPTLNQALTVKGSARDRQLKFLNTFKDRVTKKEVIDENKKIKTKNNDKLNFNEMNKLMQEMMSNGSLKNIKVDDDYDDE